MEEGSYLIEKDYGPPKKMEGKEVLPFPKKPVARPSKARVTLPAEKVPQPPRLSRLEKNLKKNLEYVEEELKNLE